VIKYFLCLTILLGTIDSSLIIYLNFRKWFLIFAKYW